jgi:N-acetylglucosaminyldiphosphoundecaprenol N-acetyl-beta-D-mannosaminyltransferase
MDESRAIFRVVRFLSSYCIRPFFIGALSMSQLCQQPGTVTINGIVIANVTMNHALDRIFEAINSASRITIYFANAHCINVSVSDEEYRNILRQENALVLGDGAGVRMASRMTGKMLCDNVNGTDMFPLLCARAVEQKRSIYLLGSSPGIPDQVVARMSAAFPGLHFAGIRHGYFSDAELDSVIAGINATTCDMVLVGFGVPKQEKWISSNRGRINAPVVIGVGGLFDYYSGRIARAPKAMRAVGLEWAWRLAMEPKRMWKRYLVGNFLFVFRICIWKWNGSIKAD